MLPLARYCTSRNFLYTNHKQTMNINQTSVRILSISFLVIIRMQKAHMIVFYVDDIRYIPQKHNMYLIE